MTERTLAVIMAGGKGERLLPLTGVRAKPAVPFGAVFRIIDFALSNCVNSDIRQILVLTQYKSHSLSRHLSTGFNFLSRRLDEFIEEIPAQMQLGNQWYKGTADAIRQNLSFIDGVSPDNVLILAGDHIYKMDYRRLRKYHKDNGAKLTVSVIRVPAEVARGQYGVLEVSPDGRIIGFEEKPAAPKCIPGTKDCMASMGIYIFENDALHTWLDNDFVDFGKDIIPAMVAQGEPVFAFDFSTQNLIEDYVVVEDAVGREKELGNTRDAGYWRDVGTLDSLWKANMDLIAVEPPFSLYGEQWPFFRGPIFFPPAKFVHEEGYRVGKAINSVIADGVIVSGGTVRQCVVGPGTVIRSYALVETSVLFGGNIHRSKVLETTIGRNCRVRNAIIDRNVTLLDGVVIGYDRKKDEARGLKTADIAGTDMYVVVVPQDAVLKPE
ncbi:MAG: glucose-1-phosphate adenylyltransferase [Deltaproteobacteria bacterium HGW-Deltaproteobacteria-17]|nr:MAG: glucose-1-phosphate adenylyltransferase [Deltaproteobacteria bacterium HGW-Deltaproteobacteria-17]